MTVTQLPLDGLLLIELTIHRDERGFFLERFNHKEFVDLQLPTKFAQDNHTRSKPGVLRGLHYQERPSQSKLVGVARGRIWDVALDMRRRSRTFGQWHAVELTDENGRLLWIPAGFAHGFCVLGDQPADVMYKVDHDYNPAGEGGIHWADRTLAIPWPVQDPLVSTRDQQLPSWQEFCHGHEE